MEEFVPIPHFLMSYHDITGQSHTLPSHSHAHNIPQPPNAHQQVQQTMASMGIPNALHENQNYEVTLNRWQPPPMHDHNHQHVGQYIPSAETIPSLGELKAAQNLHGNFIPDHPALPNHSVPPPPMAEKTPGKKRNKRKMSQKTMKQCRQAGLGYVNRKGVEVKPKEFKYKECRCRLNCGANMSAESRKEVFENYWKLGSWDLQTNFIVKTTEALEPKRRTTDKDTSRRCFSRRYYLNDVRVCKGVYLSTLQISPMRIDYTLRKKNHYGVIYPDLRGKRNNATKEAKKTIEQIQKLLSAFPMLDNSHCLDEANTVMDQQAEESKDLQHAMMMQTPPVQAQMMQPPNNDCSAMDMKSEPPTIVAGKNGKAVLKGSFKMSRDVMKHQRQTGGIYVNRKGQIIKPKEFTYVDCKCRLGCTYNLQRYVREGIFENFWKLGRWDLQTNYILQTTKLLTPRRRTTGSNPSRINWTRQYFLNDVRVCKITYCSTLQINHMRVDYCMRKISIRSEIKDQRGKATPNKTPSYVLERVEQFLKSFPKYHPPNANSNRAYFHPELNKTKLYRLYRQSLAHDERVSSFKKFKDVLKKYNVHIYVPKKDPNNPASNSTK